MSDKVFNKEKYQAFIDTSITSPPILNEMDSTFRVSMAVGPVHVFGKGCSTEEEAKESALEALHAALLDAGLPDFLYDDPSQEPVASVPVDTTPEEPPAYTETMGTVPEPPEMPADPEDEEHF